jgi:hypothetical protein
MTRRQLFVRFGGILLARTFERLMQRTPVATPPSKEATALYGVDWSEPVTVTSFERVLYPVDSPGERGPIGQAYDPDTLPEANALNFIDGVVVSGLPGRWELGPTTRADALWGLSPVWSDAERAAARKAHR